MRISNLRLEDSPVGRRAAAQVIWEQAKRPTETLFFDVGGPWADRLQLRPEAFVLACLPFAFWCGRGGAHRRCWTRGCAALWSAIGKLTRL
jgi:hypothetical protein